MEGTIETPAMPDVNTQQIVNDDQNPQGGEVTAQADQGGETPEAELARLRNENAELRLQKDVAGDTIASLQAQVTKLTNDHRDVTGQLNAVREMLDRADRQVDAYRNGREDLLNQYRNETMISRTMGGMLLMSNMTMPQLIDLISQYCGTILGDAGTRPEVKDRIIQLISTDAASAAGKLYKQRHNKTRDDEMGPESFLAAILGGGYPGRV